MSKKDKKQKYYSHDQKWLVENLKNQTRYHLRTKYYNLWLSKYKFDGLSEEKVLHNEMSNFLMRKFYKDGSVAAYSIPKAEVLGLAPYEELQAKNMYDCSTTVRLLNPHNVSDKLVPNEEMEVGTDVVIIYCRPDGGNIQSIVDYYVDRLVEAEVLINTNMRQQKFPYMIVSDEKDQDRLQSIVDDILNDRPVVYASIQDLTRIQTLITQAPYLLDKLCDYKNSIESELKQQLGIDNNGTSSSLLQTHVVSDAVNANNTETNCFRDMYTKEIQKGFDEVEEVLGFKITFEDTVEKSLSIHEEGGNYYEGTNEDKNVPNNG